MPYIECEIERKRRFMSMDLVVETDESITPCRHLQNKLLPEFEHDMLKTKLIDLLGLIHLLHQILALWSGDARIFYHQIWYHFRIMQA